MVKKRKRIVRYRRPININIGIVIFVLIFLYIAISTVIYVTREKVSIYEVVKGSSEELPEISGTGLAIRSESVSSLEASGYVNFYVKEGSRVSIGNTLYTVDESGNISEILSEATANNNVLTEDNISGIKKEISKFISEYNDNNFERVYDFKYDLNTKLIEAVNMNSINKVNGDLSQVDAGVFNIKQADKTGIVEFFTDGYETLTVDSFTNDSFNIKSYKKNQIQYDTPVEAGTPIYKTITNDNWNLIIPITKKQFEAYKDTSVVKIWFPSKDLNTVANFRTKNMDNKYYCILDLKRYMIQFCDERYIDVLIEGTTADGLKVPKSAVVKKDFNTVPEDFITTRENKERVSEIGVTKCQLNSEGVVDYVFHPVNIIGKKDNLYYVECDTINDSDTLAKSDSQTTYTYGQDKVTLSGVYNVNTGYTTFRYVDILSEKNGYYIVKSGSKYGLQVYDQIVLNAHLVKENTVIYGDY